MINTIVSDSNNIYGMTVTSASLDTVYVRLMLA